MAIEIRKEKDVALWNGACGDYYLEIVVDPQAVPTAIAHTDAAMEKPFLEASLNIIRRIVMATDFTVILFQRQHFGNQPGVFNDIEPDVPFAGPAKDFSFNCPNVNPGETAFLMFQSRDVDLPRNIFNVNGKDIFGGLPVSPSRDTWNSNILLIESRHELKPANNVLRVESRNASGGSNGDLDDFIIDNVVIVYKTR